MKKQLERSDHQPSQINREQLRNVKGAGRFGVVQKGVPVEPIEPTDGSATTKGWIIGNGIRTP